MSTRANESAADRAARWRSVAMENLRREVRCAEQATAHLGTELQGDAFRALRWAQDSADAIARGRVCARILADLEARPDVDLDVIVDAVCGKAIRDGLYESLSTSPMSNVMHAALAREACTVRDHVVPRLRPDDAR